MNNLSTLCLRMIQRHKWHCALVAIFIFSASFVFLYSLATPMWQASGLVRIGQAPYSNDKKIIALGLLMPLESTMVLIRQNAERVVEENTTPNKEWSFRIKPAAEGILDLKVEASSPEVATKIHHALVTELKAVHEELFQTRSAFWKSQEAMVSSSLEVGQRIWKSQTTVCAEIAAKQDDGSLLCANLLLNENLRQNELANLQRTIREALLPIWTYPTDGVGSINVSNDPVSPNFLVAVALSFLIALSLSLILLIVSCVWSALSEPLHRDS